MLFGFDVVNFKVDKLNNIHENFCVYKIRVYGCNVGAWITCFKGLTYTVQWDQIQVIIFKQLTLTPPSQPETIN